VVRAERTSWWRMVIVGLVLSLLALACGNDEPAAESGTGTEPGAATSQATSQATSAATDGERDATDTGPTQEADVEAASLEGETIDFIVPYDPGGGYDTYVRLIAPYLEECTGASVIVRNEPGAGGLLATTQTFVAAPEQLRIQIINTIGAASAQIAGAEGARFELQDFSWLGRIASEPNVMVVASDSEIQSFDDVLAAEEPIKFVATGPGSNEYVNSVILPEVYDFPADVITGFAGSGEARAAVLAGDADAHILPLDSQIDAINAGETRPILIIGQERSETLPDVPAVADYPAGSEEQQAIVDALAALVETGRAVAAPPGMDEATLSALREGLACALQDEELINLAEEQQRPISPLSGEEMADLIRQVLDSPEAFQQLVTEAS